MPTNIGELNFESQIILAYLKDNNGYEEGVTEDRYADRGTSGRDR